MRCAGSQVEAATSREEMGMWLDRSKSGRRGWILGVVAGLAFWGIPVGQSSAATLHVMTTDGVPGGQIRLDMRLERASEQENVATIQVDLLFDTRQLNLGGRCSDDAGCTFSEQCSEGDACRFVPQPCVLDSQLTGQTLEVIPPDFQNVGPNLYRLRFAVLATQLPISAIRDGGLLSCTFDVREDAQAGVLQLLAERLQVADNSVPARALTADVMLHAGRILGETPTLTPSPGETETPTGTPETPGPETPTVTPTPPTPAPTTPPTERTPCPSVRPAPSGPAVYAEDLVLASRGQGTEVVRLATGGNAIVATQNDLEFGQGVQVNRRPDGRPDCTVNPGIRKEGTAFAFLPGGCADATCTAVRAVVISFENTDAISDGAVLYTCEVTVEADETELRVSNVILSDAAGDRIPGSTGREGAICVEPVTPTVSPTPTVTGTPQTPVSPAATPTGTPTLPGVSPTSTATVPSPTITGTVASPTATRTAPRTATATATAVLAAEGDGCDCNIASGRRGGWSSVWLSMPAWLLWRRRKAVCEKSR